MHTSYSTRPTVCSNEHPDPSDGNLTSSTTNTSDSSSTATLPRSLGEFAGLQSPNLVHLDAETRISADHHKGVLLCQASGEGYLPPRPSPRCHRCSPRQCRDRSRLDHRQAGQREGTKAKHLEHAADPHPTLIFAATKHHVEYLTNLFTTTRCRIISTACFDQTVRSLQMVAFRRG